MVLARDLKTALQEAYLLEALMVAQLLEVHWEYMMELKEEERGWAKMSEKLKANK